MLFFALVAVMAALAAAAGSAGVPGLSGPRAWLRVGLAGAMLFFGIDHLVTPGRYIPMIEAFLPYPWAIVIATGLCEIAGGIGLMVPRLRRAAGMALAVYFVCVFPANIANALSGVTVDGLPAASWYYWLRLPLQPVAILLALHAGDVLPRRRTSRPEAMAARTRA